MSNDDFTKPYLRRVAKSLDNPLNTNPNMLWEVKRQNHKLLKTERNPKLREKMVQEIIEADQQLIKNIDEETNWFTEEREKISKQIDEEKKKGSTNPWFTDEREKISKQIDDEKKKGK